MRLLSFQFALPHGERPSSKSPNPSTARFQFALPHGERLIADQIQMLGSKVSIRAPAWGATRATAQTVAAHRSFNSRSRMGSDATQTTLTLTGEVSIRAPAWERLVNITSEILSFLFQFALPHGERRRMWCGKNAVTQFQFALPHGERQARVGDELLGLEFQFALPHGERHVI